MDDSLVVEVIVEFDIKTFNIFYGANNLMSFIFDELCLQLLIRIYAYLLKVVVLIQGGKTMTVSRRNVLLLGGLGVAGVAAGLPVTAV